MMVVNISNEDLKKLEETFMPSPWLQRAIDRIHSMNPYPSKEEKRKILDEEKREEMKNENLPEMRLLHSR